MTQIFKATYARDLYNEQLQTLIDLGEPVDVRGRKTMEILNAVTEISEPWHHCILLPARRWNPWLAMSEALWILAGRNDVAALEPYNSRIKEFSDDGIHLYGAYGPRIVNQIDTLIGRLRRDDSDRRAVLQIWDVVSSRISSDGSYKGDLEAETKDPPCNNLVYFKLRDNKLHMTVICRSNDIHWGLYAVNLPTFGILQVYIAARLGVEIGTQTHLSNSLHVYTDDKAAAAITDRMLYKAEGENRPPYPKHSLVFSPSSLEHINNHKDMAELCSATLDGDLGKSTKDYPYFLAFASGFLKAYRERDESILKAAMLIFPEFADWITAGDIFVQEVWNRKKPVNA